MTDSDKIFLSLIVPFYAVEHYIADCLESCVNQTWPHIEILCVDDCSPDKSVDVVRKFMKKDSRIKLFRHAKNRGLGGARNTGIEHATGDYIWFIDSDDCIRLNAFELLVNKIRQYTKPDIVCINYAEME